MPMRLGLLLDNSVFAPPQAPTSALVTGQLLGRESALLDTGVGFWSARESTAPLRVTDAAATDGVALSVKGTGLAPFVDFENSPQGQPVSVAAGQTYTFRAEAIATVASRTAETLIEWRDSTNTAIGASVKSSGVALSTTAYAQVAHSFTAPAGATRLYIYCRVFGGVAAGEEVRWSRFSLHAGTSTALQSPDSNVVSWTAPAAGQAPQGYEIRRGFGVKVEESFTRANSSTLGVAPNGQTWVQQQGSIGIVNNGAQVNGTTGANRAMLDAQWDHSRGIYAEVDITFKANTAPGVLLASSADATNCLGFQINNTETRVFKIEGGTYNFLNTGGGAHVDGVTYKCRLEVTPGGIVRYYQDGVQLVGDRQLTATEITNLRGVDEYYVGIQDDVTNTNVRWDNFEAGYLPEAIATVGAVTSYTDPAAPIFETVHYTVAALTGGLAGPESNNTTNIYRQGTIPAAPGGVAVRTHDFADQLDGTLPPGDWAYKNTGRAFAADGSMRLSSGSAFADDRSLMLGSVHTDVELLLRVRARFSPSAEHYFGVNFRADNNTAGGTNSTTTNQYNFEFQSVGMYLYKIVNGVGTIIADGNGVANRLTSTAWKWVRIRAVGSTLQVKTWDAAVAEPTAWSLTATDTAHTVGQFRLQVSGAAATQAEVLIDDLALHTLVAPAAKAATYTNNFDSGTLSSQGGWTISGTPAPTIVSGALELAPQSGASYTSANRAGGYDFTDSSMYCEAQSFATGKPSTENYFEIRRSLTPSSSAQIMHVASGLRLRLTQSGVRATDTTIPFDATAHRWWRFRHAGYTLYWETSPDGLAWTVRRQHRQPFDLSLAELRLGHGAFDAANTETMVGVTRFDNINTAGVPAFSGSAGLSGSGQLSVQPEFKSTSATAGLTGSGSLSVARTISAAAAAGLTGSGSLSTAGTALQTATAAVGLAGSGSLVTGVSQVATTAAVPLTGSGALSASLTSITFVRDVALSGSGSLTVAQTAVTAVRTAALAGSGTLSVTSLLTASSTASLAGVGSLTATLLLSGAASAALSGTGALSVAGVAGSSTAVPLSGSGALAATSVAFATATGAATLAGTGSLTTAAAAALMQAVPLSGAGALSVAQTAVAVTRAVTLTGSGTLAAQQAAQTSAGTAALTGTGSLSLARAISASATAAFTGTGSLTASLIAGGAAAVALAGTGQLTATAAFSLSATAPLTGSGTLSISATALATATATAGFTGAGSLTVAGTPAQRATVGFTGAGQLSTALTSVTATGAATLSGTGQLAATQTAVTASRTAAFTGTGALTASTATAASRTVTLAGSGSLAATQAALSAAAQAAFTGAGSLAMARSVSVSTTAPLTGTGDLTAAGSPGLLRTVGFTGAGALTAITSLTASGSAAFTGSGALTTSSAITAVAAAALTGSGALTTALVAGLQTSVSLSGSGALTASLVAGASQAAALAGSGVLSAAGTPSLAISAPLTGAGALSVAGTAVTTAATAAFSGSGATTLTVFAVSEDSAAAALAGTGQLSTVVTVTVVRTALLTGSGSLTSSQTITALATTVLAGSGALVGVFSPGPARTVLLSGTGSLTSGVSPEGRALALLAGSGALVGTGTHLNALTMALLTGLGELSTSVLITAAAVAAFTGTGSLLGSRYDEAALTGEGTLTVGLAILEMTAAANLTGDGTLYSMFVGALAAFVSLTGRGNLLAYKDGRVRRGTATLTLQQPHGMQPGGLAGTSAPHGMRPAVRQMTSGSRGRMDPYPRRPQ